MEKVNARKVFLVIIIILILLVIALFIGKFTFSYLAPDVGEDASNKGEVTASGDTIIFNTGKALSLSATADNFTTGGTNLTDTSNPTAKLVASSKTNKADATYYVGVYIKNNTYTYSTTDKTPEVLLTIKDEKGNNVTSVDGLTYATSGGVSGFDITDKTGLFNVKTDYPISTTSSSTGTTHTWTFTLTFVNLSTDQSVNENANMNIDVVLQQETKVLTLAEACTGKTLSDCIKSQYTGTQGDNNIYYHDSSLTNGAGDSSYRYSGANPNNYVCFGSNDSTCPTDNLYRIIGVFGNNVKLIKYDYGTTDELGTDGDYYQTYKEWRMDSTYKGTYGDGERIGVYYWNKSTQKNTWSESLLNKTNLNTNFINNIGEEWANKIATTTWKVGGNTYSNIASPPPSVVYQNEIVNPVTTKTTDNATEYTAKIGLMYVSDYGFAADPSAWTLTMDSYNNTTATSTNWMYMGLYEWTLSRIADYSDRAFRVNYDGSVGHDYVYGSYAVRPSFNLESSITYVSGSGSDSDPMVIN